MQRRPTSRLLIVSVAWLVTQPTDAEMTAEVGAVTALVVTVKLALAAPAGTVMLAGTVASVLLQLSVTASPPTGAAALKVALPVEELPPATLVGLRLTEGCATVRTV